MLDGHMFHLLYGSWWQMRTPFNLTWSCKYVFQYLLTEFCRAVCLSKVSCPPLMLPDLKVAEFIPERCVAADGISSVQCMVYSSIVGFVVFR